MTQDTEHRALHPTIAQLWQRRATAIIRTNNTRQAADAMDAAVRGGIRSVEFTMTTPGALSLIEEFSRRSDLAVSAGVTDLVVGAGTVLRPEEARRAVQAGARFLVSPIFDPEIVAAAARLGVPVIPGINTPSEAVAAHRAGAPLVKLFPAPAGGPAWLRSTLAPLPFLRVVPTSGVDNDNAAQWLEAGAWSVGLVASLFVREEVLRREFEPIEARAAEAMERVLAVERGDPPPITDPWLDA